MSKKKRCLRKVTHDTREHACIALRKTLKNMRKNGTLVIHYRTIYKGPLCKKWHIGKSKATNYKIFNELIG